VKHVILMLVDLTGLTFEQLTLPTAVQREAFELLGVAIPLRFK
jgi:hypothetical protein